MKIGQKPRISVKLKQRLSIAARVRMAGCMQLTEHEFEREMRAVESDPLFRKLFAPRDNECRIIAYKRFKGTRFLVNFVALNEAVSRDDRSPDVESLAVRHAAAVPLVRRIGTDNFEKFFLYNEGEFPAAAAAAACGLTEKEIGLINRFVDDLCLHGEFFNPPRVSGPAGLPCYKVAVIGRDLTIHFCSPKFAQGKYIVDYERLKALKKSGYFPEDELAGLNTLLARIEVINAKKNTIVRILEKVVEKQRAFLVSGDERDLVAYPQRELARDLSLDDSLISRALYRRSVGFADGREQPLRSFFPNRKSTRKILIAGILRERQERISDREIRDILRKEHNIVVARRTVNSCRNELRGNS